MISHQELLYNYNAALRDHYAEGPATNLDTALQCSLWRNAVACTGQEYMETPKALLAHWCGMDSLARYKHNFKDPVLREQLVQHGWLDTTIDYHINSWGFRADREYVSIDEPCLVAIGCSYTYGIGLHEHQIWPRLLADRLGVQLVNLGVPGHGLDLSSLWLLLQGHHITNPVAVVVLEPPMGRLSWMTAINDTVLCAENMINLADVDHRGRILSTLLLNSAANTVKNYHLISNWATSKHVPFVWSDKKQPEIKISLARDLAHFGYEWHQAKAEEFYDHLKNT